MSNSNISIETLPFRISSVRYFGVIVRMLLRQWWSVALLLLTLMIVATCFDVRFGIVILMFLFIILPLILFFVYYNYALRPEAFYSVTEKAVHINKEGIDCIYDSKQRNVLHWNDVKRIVVTPKGYQLFTGNYTYFYIPRDAFADKDTIDIFEQTFIYRVIS